MGKIIDLSAHFQSRQDYEAAWESFEEHTLGCTEGCANGGPLCAVGQVAAASVWNRCDPKPRRSLASNQRRRSS